MMKYFEMIPAYLEGELDNTERRAFEEEMGRNDLLRKEVELHQDVDASLSESDIIRLRAKLNSIHTGMLDAGNEARVIRLKPRHTLLAVAAVAVLLVASVWVFNLLSNPSLTPDELYAMYYQPDDAVMVMRSGGQQGEGDLLTEALRRYEQADYAGALKLFKEDKSNLMVHFYSGLAYMEIEMFSEAIRSFQTILDDQQNLFLEQAQWYQGLCYIKIGRNDKARSVLQELGEANGPYKAKVDFILKNLKK
ncbi:MAG: zf-HC2 domain-containing protein [Bacteroidales bacterium]|nr:zf-HC2 domain-containing protein [Bacteroidales bacterium]